MLLHGRGLAWSSLSWSLSQVLDNAANNFAILWFSMVVLLSLAWVEQQALGLPAWFPLRHLHIPLGLGETVVLDLLLMVEKMVVLSYSQLSNWKRWMQWFRTRWFAPPHGLPPSGPWSRHLPPPSGFSPRLGAMATGQPLWVDWRSPQAMANVSSSGSWSASMGRAGGSCAGPSNCHGSGNSSSGSGHSSSVEEPPWGSAGWISSW